MKWKVKDRVKLVKIKGSSGPSTMKDGMTGTITGIKTCLHIGAPSSCKKYCQNLYKDILWDNGERSANDCFGYSYKREDGYTLKKINNQTLKDLIGQ